MRVHVSLAPQILERVENDGLEVRAGGERLAQLVRGQERWDVNDGNGIGPE